MNEKFYEKYAWIIFLIIGVMVVAGGIPHALGFNTDPTLVQTISGQTIENLKTSIPMFFNLYNFYFFSQYINCNLNFIIINELSKI